MFTTLGRRDKTKKQNANYNCNKPSANRTAAGGSAVMVVADSSGGPAVWCPIMVSDIGGDEEQLGMLANNLKVFSMLNAPWSTCDQKFQVGIVRRLCVGNETWIFESEGGGGGRGVKVKQYGNGGILKPTTNVAATATVSPTVPTSSTPTSYAKLFTGDKSRNSMSFRTLITPAGNGVNVVVPVESIRAISERSSSARAMIKLRADVELKDTVMVVMPKIIGEGFYTCNIRVEYEWKPPRSSQVVFLPPQKLFAYVTGGDVNSFGVWIRQHTQGLKEPDEMKNETKRFA
ncbi:hypothetical protein Tco_1274257 [Tanacetum coccineum]